MMTRNIFVLVVLLGLSFTNQSVALAADGSISASASTLELLIHETVNGTISITDPDKPEDTDEVHYLGTVTHGTPTVTGSYTPFPTTQNPNPSSSSISGVSNLTLTSFKFTGHNPGTWKETFTVSFSSIATEVYNPDTDSWESGEDYAFADATCTITFTVKLCEKKCSGDVVAVIPLGYDFNADAKGIKAMFNAKLHHCTTGSHSCHKVNFNNVNVNEAGKYVIRCQFDAGASPNHGCNPANCEDLGEIWVVRIGGMEYKIGNGNWNNVGSGMKVPVNCSVDFRVKRNPVDAPAWPSTYPKWTKPDSSTSIGDSITYLFKDLSPLGSNGDHVQCVCGTSTAFVNVLVVGVDHFLYYFTTTGYVPFPNLGTATHPNYCLYTDASYERIFVEARNTRNNHSQWPEEPNPKPVWSGGAVNYGTPPEPQYRARIGFNGYSAGDTIDFSAECGNTKSAKVILCGLDLVLDGLSENDEENPGACIGVTKRKKLEVNILPDTAVQGQVTLQLNNGLKIYENATSQTVLASSALTWNLANNQKPATEYYVGCDQSSTAMRDKSATLKWQLQGELSDSVAATIVGVNVATTDTTEPTEESPGTFIPINTSKEVTITYEPNNLDLGELELSGGSGKLAFYHGTTPLTSTAWNLANTTGSSPTVTVPGTITIKGINHGEVSYLKLKHDKSGAEDKLKVTVYELILEAPGKMVEMSPGVFHVPVMLNDNHDCGLDYTATWNCSVNCPNGCTGDHRELEPVWDMNYIGSYSDSDIVPFKLEMKPNTMPGSVTLKVTSGAARVRFWQNANKGGKSTIISVPKTYSISTLPTNFYTEGIQTGDVTFEATYNPPSNINVNATQTLNAHIVSLIEKQGNVRKIINANTTPIDFTVESGNAFNGKIAWTVPNHNNSSSLGTTNTISVSYGAATNHNVTLPENAANRRFTTTVGASIDGKLLMERNIRVAQATYQGTAVATTTPARRTEVAGLATLPTMDAMPVNTGTATNPTPSSSQYFDNQYGTDFVGNGNAQIQYATLLSDYGLTVAVPGGINRKVYVVMVSKTAYDTSLKQEDLTAIANHEARHAYQNVWMRNGNTDWMLLESILPFSNSRVHFMEADAYTTNLNSLGSWKYIDTRFNPFIANYNAALQVYNTLRSNAVNGTTQSINVRNTARNILQDIYQAIPTDFKEMKRYTGNTYNNQYIRAPQ
jgi:hypothetical protein